MGKTQSKRSVDITTEGGKTKGGTVEDDVVITGKLEKIEDIDQQQQNPVNGDAANPQEYSNDTEKKDVDESENDKDLTTEKCIGDTDNALISSSNVPVPNGEEEQRKSFVEPASTEENGAKENAGSTPATEDISPLAEESMKKSKKERKKKWSFRSISFGKKDKQKPSKTEENVEDAAAEPKEGASDVPIAIEASKRGDDAEVADDDKIAMEQVNNPVQTSGQKNFNSEQAPSLIVDVLEKPAEELAVTHETISANTAVASAAATTDNSNTNETATIIAITNNITEITEIAETEDTNITNNAVALAAEQTNGTTDQTVIDVVNECTSETAEGSNAAVNATTENISSVTAAAPEGNVTTNGDSVVHQNGNGTAGNEDAEPDVELIAATKSLQIEVNRHTDINLPDTKLAPSTITTITNSTTNTSCDPNIEISNDSQKTHTTLEPLEMAASNEATTIVETNNDTRQHKQGVIEDNGEKTEIEQDPTSQTNVGAQDLDQAEQEANTEQLPKAEDQGCLMEPPPLPILPPPSQVSVFAFDNTNNSVTTENTATDQATDTHITNETDRQQKDEENEEKLLKAALLVDEITEQALAIVHDQRQQQQVIAPGIVDEAVATKMEFNSILEDDETAEKRNVEPPKAAETLDNSQQMRMLQSENGTRVTNGNGHIDSLILLDADVNGKQPNDTLDVVPIVSYEENENVADILLLPSVTTKGEPLDLLNSNNGGLLLQPQHNSDTNEQPEQLCVVSARISSPSKEIASAKGLKENNAVATEQITTQKDLPVTCE